MTFPPIPFSRVGNSPPYLLGALLPVLWTTLLAAAVPAQAQEPVTRIEFLKYGAMAVNVAQSPNGEYIAIGVREAPTGEGRVVLWNRSQQKRTWSQSFPTQQAPEVAFDSTGSRLAIATGTGEIVVRHIAENRTVDFGGETTPVADIAFGPGGALGVGGSRQDGGVRVWTNGSMAGGASFSTEGPVQSIAFRPNAPELVFTSRDTQVTLWNYRFDTTKTIETTNLCSGKIFELDLSRNSNNIFITTKAYAKCNPDYLCIVNAKNVSLVDKYRRKNISQIESIGNGKVYYSRGKYVYRINVQNGMERIIFKSDNKVNDLSYANGYLVVANSNVVVLDV